MKTIADSLGALQDLIPHSATGLKARSFVDPAAVEQGKTGRQGTSTSGSRAVGRSGGSSLPDPDEILLSRQRERLKISSDSEQDRSLAEDVKPLDARKVPNPDPIPEPSSHRESSKAPVKRKKTKLLVSDEGLVEIEIDDEYDAPVAVLEAQELDDAIGEALTRIGETESNGAGEGQAPLETESNKEFSRLDEEDDVSPDSEPVSYPDDDEDDDSVLGQLDPISEIGVELDSALDEVLQIHLSQDVESESRSDGNNIRTRKSEPQSAGVKFLEEPEGDVTRAVHSAHSSVADVLKGVLDGMEDIQLEPAPEASTRKSAGSRPGDNVQKAPPAVAAEFPGSQVDALRISRPSAIPEGRERVVGVPLDDSQPKREIREVFDLPLEGHVFLHELQGGLAEGLRYLKERWEDPDSTVDRFYTLLPSIEETFPDDPRIPFANGVLAHLAGRRVDGLSALQRALDRYLQVKDTEGQQLCLEHIHSHFPEDIGIAERLAHLYEAIDLKGRAALVYQKLGESCVARGQERQGIGYFEKSLDLDGSRRDAALELIRGYRFMKDENKALDTAQRVLQSLPEDPFMKIMKAISLDRLGRSRAARTLVEGVAQDPKAQVHTDSLRRLFLEASERDLLQVFSGFESSMDSLSDGFLSDGSTSEGSSVHSLEDIQTDSAPGSRPVVGHLPGWDPSKVVSEGTTPETQARNVPRETRSPALSARAPESPPREEFPVDGRGRDAENMDMNGTLFDRIRRQVPRMSSNLKSLQSMEADVQDAHKRGILKDRAVARLLRSFQELGDALRPDAPDESHAVYRKGLEYIGWFEDQISRSLWRDDLDQRLRD